MSLSSVNEIGPGKTLTPNSELERLNSIAANRRLYRGNFTSLIVGDIDADAMIGGVKVNWFRRVAKFYPEFMLSETPEITVVGNDRFTSFIADRAKALWAQVSQVNTDGIRYGYGVLASHPDDPTQFWAVEPDSHYEVATALGDVTHDLILRRRVGEEGNGQLDVYVYPVADEEEPVRLVYRLSAGIVGELIETIPLPSRSGRQVLFFNIDNERTSWYDDIKDSVGEISRSLTSLGGTIRRNSRPHLHGPAGAVVVGQDGKAQVSQEGTYFPLEQGDKAPGYLQWDAKLESVSYDIGKHEDTIYTMTGLNKLLFESEQTTGVASGVALRRLMLPFVARLNHLKTLNQCLVADALAMMSRNNKAIGGELFSYEARNVEIDFLFDAVFMDGTETSTEEV